jgi:hypothetical protein
MIPMVKKTILGGLAALTIGVGVAATSTTADAQVFYGPGYRYGYYGGYWPGYRYRPYNGGAVAAGLVGGLALGALAATAAQPYYAAPAYGRCWIERRRVADAWGNLYVRPVRVCN